MRKFVPFAILGKAFWNLVKKGVPLLCACEAGDVVFVRITNITFLDENSMNVFRPHPSGLSKRHNSVGSYGVHRGFGGVETNKQACLFRRILTPWFQIIGPVVKIRFEIWHTPFFTLIVHIGRGHKDIKRISGFVIFAKKGGYCKTIVGASVTSNSISIPNTSWKKSDRMH